MKIVIFVVVLLLMFTTSIYAVDFVISAPTVNNTEISLEASVSGSNNYYLQGVLRAVESSKYFGETKNNKGEWIDYIGSPEKEYITSNFFLTDIKDASWSGILNIRFKVDDANYKGAGNYELKLKRFTGNSSNAAGESNTLIVTLSAVLPSPTVSPSPVNTPSPSPSSLPDPSPSKATPSLDASPLPSPSVLQREEGTVAGETIVDLSNFGTSPLPSPSILSPNNKLNLNYDRAKIVILIGGGLAILSLAGFWGYSCFRKNKLSEL